jgi:ribose 5-phosphate isomerase B
LLACWITSLTNLKKIFISSDHAGFELKETIKTYLSKKKLSYQDMGPYSDDRVDYPDFAHKVARKVKTNKKNVGILVCGSGMGMNIAANKHKNIRAAQCFNLKSTKLSRLHNDANIITLGSRLLTKKNALNCVSIFLNTKFEGGRHSKRIKKI